MCVVEEVVVKVMEEVVVKEGIWCSVDCFGVEEEELMV